MTTARPQMPYPDREDPKTRGALAEIASAAAACTQCKLHEHRTNSVFGTGHSNADLMFVGEGPGPDEDVIGEPFVGRSGDLLNKIVGAIGIDRAHVYMTNVVLCRLDDERHLTKGYINACRDFLTAQIEAVEPRIIVPLGSTAWRWFSPRDKRKMADVRGAVYDWNGLLLVPTYHPAFLLRKAEFKGDVWKDMQIVIALMNGNPDPTGAGLLKIEAHTGNAAVPTEPSLFD